MRRKSLIKTEYSIFIMTVAAIVSMLIFMFSTAASANQDHNHKICCPGEENNQVFVFTEPTIKSEEIAEIQAALKKLGFYNAETNGQYDRITETAVKKFQQSCGMHPDGIFGKDTRRALSRVFESETEQVTTKVNLKGTVFLVINIDKKKLYVYNDGKKVKEFGVAVGKERTPTPVGEWKVERKSMNWGTGFGTRWMGLNVPWGLYGIHGTNKPWSIGTEASGGCIRMFNSDVEELYNWVKVGTTVRIEGQVFEPFYEDRWPRHKGHRGSDVILIQKGLAAEGYLKAKPDGVFGDATENALKKLQKDRGFEVSGQVDTDIWGVLGL